MNYRAWRVAVFAPSANNHIVFIVLFVSVLVGCGGATGNLSPENSESLDTILTILQSNYDLTSTVRILQMVVTIEDKDGKEEVRESLWYKRSLKDGDLLHIQAMGPLNEPRVIAIAARGQFLLYFANEQEAIFERLEDGVLREIFGLDLRISDVRSALFANPFLDGRTTELTIVSTGAKHVVKRLGTKENHLEEITILVRDGEPTVSQWKILDQIGNVIQQIEFSDYRDVGGVLRPHDVEIERPAEHTRVVLKIRNPEINIDINDSKFDFEPFRTESTKIRTLQK
ncbi:MAG: hypothetical protein OXN17_12035 [Candidatus Poribacteria bacterium]|nr:hypothetical protein [Candidatus Poribacteria bacterium]MDE0505831.1 hypothetical protein [Candidatus Poribacteria bacterium]